jgi:hypothetical protein
MLYRLSYDGTATATSREGERDGTQREGSIGKERQRYVRLSRQAGSAGCQWAVLSPSLLLAFRVVELVAEVGSLVVVHMVVHVAMEFVKAAMGRGKGGCREADGEMEEGTASREMAGVCPESENEHVPFFRRLSSENFPSGQTGTAFDGRSEQIAQTVCVCWWP